MKGHDAWVSVVPGTAGHNPDVDHILQNKSNPSKFLATSLSQAKWLGRVSALRINCTEVEFVSFQLKSNELHHQCESKLAPISYFHPLGPGDSTTCNNFVISSHSLQVLYTSLHLSTTMSAHQG